MMHQTMGRQRGARALGAAIASTALLCGVALGAHHDQSSPGLSIVATGRAAPPETASPSSSAPTRPTSTGSAVGPPGAGPRVAIAASSGSPAPTGVTPAAPGTYRYRQTSSQPGTPTDGTLVVTPASAAGTEVWTRNVGGNVRPSSSVMLFNAMGAFLLSPSTAAAGTPGSCSFASPLPWPPSPLSIGRSFGGDATCSGPVRTYHVTGSIDRSDALQLDGRTIATFRVVSNFVLQGSYSGSPLNVTMTETDWYAPSLRVPVQTRTHLAGTVLGITVTSDTNYVLASSTPT